LARPTHFHDLPAPDLPGVDATSQAAVRAMMRTVRLQRQLMSRLLQETCGHDLHPAQATCLQVLAANDGITQRDLARTLHLSPPTVTAMLQRMEASGVIERRPDAADQRLSRVYVTPAGRGLQEELRCVFAERIRQTFGSMEPEDRRELERLLTVLSDNTARALDTAAGADSAAASAGKGPNR
jgi:DNA-binding MarR family transcriptional regulator